MMVNYGYVLQESDYPTVHEKTGYDGSWIQYVAEIQTDVQIEAKYTIKTYRITFRVRILIKLQTSDVLHEENLVSSQNAGGAASTAAHESQTLASTQSVQHEYVTQNGKVVRETVRTNGAITAVQDFIYDESGNPFALKHSTNGSSFTTYYYVLNLHGDVVKLITASGATVAEYTYNAWGEILTSTGTIASINPLRYRGYYYDSETGFYYLQSRYYDPVSHRFINADASGSTGQGFTGTKRN